MTQPLPDRKSYLLRLWKVKIGGRFVLRACLILIPGGKERRFNSLEQLYKFLKDQDQLAGRSG